jgi:hypothetical protein
MKGEIAMRCAVLVALFVGVACSGEPAKPLTDVDREHVRKELDYRKLPQPTKLEVRDDGYIVATYEIAQGMTRMSEARQLGESTLIAIREALLDKGYRDFRVNVNGPPPGTGLIRRYGSARYIGSGGKVEWLTPEND